MGINVSMQTAVNEVVTSSVIEVANETTNTSDNKITQAQFSTNEMEITIGAPADTCSTNLAGYAAVVSSITDEVLKARLLAAIPTAQECNDFVLALNSKTICNNVFVVQRNEGWQSSTQNIATQDMVEYSTLLQQKIEDEISSQYENDQSPAFGANFSAQTQISSAVKSLEQDIRQVVTNTRIAAITQSQATGNVLKFNVLATVDGDCDFTQLNISDQFSEQMIVNISDTMINSVAVQEAYALIDQSGKTSQGTDLTVLWIVLGVVLGIGLLVGLYFLITRGTGSGAEGRFGR